MILLCVSSGYDTEIESRNIFFRFLCWEFPVQIIPKTYIYIFHFNKSITIIIEPSIYIIDSIGVGLIFEIQIIAHFNIFTEIPAFRGVFLRCFKMVSLSITFKFDSNSGHHFGSDQVCFSSIHFKPSFFLGLVYITVTAC